MASAFERACTRAMVGCFVLGMVGCRGASKDAGVSPALSGNAPAVPVMVASPIDPAMDNEFADEGEMQDESMPVVVSMQPRLLDPASANLEELEDCQGWALTSEDAQAFFAMSHPVDARTWDAEHEAPCAITGIVHSDGMDWEFSINGASKATWRSGNAVRYLSCDSRECEQFSS